jgi:hypothetical protein
VKNRPVSIITHRSPQMCSCICKEWGNLTRDRQLLVVPATPKSDSFAQSGITLEYFHYSN